MSYFPAGHRVIGSEIDDFEDCDLTHYTGGYDIDLTYGRSLPPSYETCYPYKSSLPDHPPFASHSRPSAYAREAADNQYSSFYGPKPSPGPMAEAGGRGYGGPKPHYAFQPGGARNEYARPEPGYGSGHSMSPPNPKFGSSHERKSDYGESGYGPGVWKPVSDIGGSRYESGGWPEKPAYPKPSYPNPSYPMPSYPEPSYPMPSYPEPSYPMPSYPEPSYPMPSYPDPSYPMPSYPDPSYPTPRYPHKYEHDNSDYQQRMHDQSHHHGRRR